MIRGQQGPHTLFSSYPADSWEGVGCVEEQIGMIRSYINIKSRNFADFTSSMYLLDSNRAAVGDTSDIMELVYLVTGRLSRISQHHAIILQLFCCVLDKPCHYVQRETLQLPRTKAIYCIYFVISIRVSFLHSGHFRCVVLNVYGVIGTSLYSMRTQC